MPTNTVMLGKASPGKDMRVYAIGDVHGCRWEMGVMLDLIEQDLSASPMGDHRIIFLGDYCDRGPDVCGVIDRLMGLRAQDERVVCLLGNHDDKLRKAHKVLDPRDFAMFLRYGGAATLASYGADARELQRLELQGDEKARKRVRDIVRDVVPKAHFEFIKNLPRSVEIGDYFFCHAGVDPDRKFHKQDGEDLIWIREPFLSHKKPLAKVVIHGHTRQTRVDVRDNRINVDTSCCYGGALSCVVLEKKKYRFLQVPARQQHWLAG
ncbi:MAG: metallophosphoesterase family protein [Pseudomonadota bacterium]